MDVIFTLLGESFFIGLPVGLWGWLAWMACLVLAAGLAWRAHALAPAWNSRLSFVFIILLMLTPACVLLLGLRLPEAGFLPPPGRPQLPTGPALMVLAAVPWVVAAGVLGPLPAALLAAFSGLLLAGFDSHNIFQPLTQAIQAILLSVALRQRYRTLAFSLWRRPLLASTAIGLLHAPLVLATLPFTVSGTLAIRLDYALAGLGWVTLAGGVPLLVAGLLAEVVAFGLGPRWGGPGTLQPSPAERSLQARQFTLLGPLGLLLLLLIAAGIWRVAGDAANSMLEQRLRTSADAAAQGVPFFLETGQTLIAQLAGDARLIRSSGDALRAALAEDLRSVPYFDQLAVLDVAGRLQGGFPVNDGNALLLTPQELQAVELAFAGVQFQMYALPPGADATSGRMAFLQALRDESGAVVGVLLGRTSLSINPFTVPILDNLRAVQEDIGGQGILLDDQGLIMAHPIPQLVGTQYTGQVGEQPALALQLGSDGTRQLIYTRPTAGRGWAVVTTVPARVAQQLAIEIAAPALAGVLGLMGIVFAVIGLGLRGVTGSLNQLADISSQMAGGNLDQPLALAGTDELGQLGQSFEHLRLSLKSRLDELNRLLSVSQGVASALDMEKAVGPVLTAALSLGASAARLALTPAGLPDFEEEHPTHYGQGPAASRYQPLDDALLALTARQPRVALSDPAKARLNTPEGAPLPQALLAVALHHEGTHYGVLWLAFDGPRTFTEDEMSFLSTLAGQAALAAANARLYLSAQLGRQRLEAILASTPDPVLVTDYRDRLLLANPAAEALFGAGALAPGQPVGEVISQPELRALLASGQAETDSIELALGDNRIFYATASSVHTEGRQMGRVCVLRDITHYKEVDALKSEFVATVSHDLRSPLTVMRGYATMLQMVGSLNEQQTGYLKKIDTGIQSMSRLVNNLLDLGRIEAGVGLRLEMVPVADLARQVAEALRPQALQKAIILTLETPANTMPLVEADTALLQQALHNLVENAIKYTESGGEVAVRLTVTPEAVAFRVQDTGLGIAPVDLPRLFERFYRVAGRETRKQPGSGLGLAIVKSIAERHGGSIRVESKLGEGSVFTLAIPLRQ